MKGFDLVLKGGLYDRAFWPMIITIIVVILIAIITFILVGKELKRSKK